VKSGTSINLITCKDFLFDMKDVNGLATSSEVSRRLFQILGFAPTFKVSFVCATCAGTVGRVVIRVGLTFFRRSWSRMTIAFLWVDDP
jgi:hypothetical protein